MSIKKTKKSKKSERNKLVKKLDTVFSKYIRMRDKKCVICGSTQNLQAGHLITRLRYSTRWDEENCFAQCRNCNYIHNFRPEIFTSWFIEKFGAKKYKELVYRSRIPVKYTETNNDLISLIKKYKQKIEKLKQKEHGGK